MACCGRQTPGIAGPAATGQVRPASAAYAGRTRSGPRTHAYFEYIGRRGMTAIGAVTGRRYRFERPGERIAVDPVDKPSLAKVPHLKPVPGP